MVESHTVRVEVLLATGINISYHVRPTPLSFVQDETKDVLQGVQGTAVEFQFRAWDWASCVHALINLEYRRALAVSQYQHARRQASVRD